MIPRLLALIRALVSALQSHQSLALENLALRQQLANLKAKSPRPTITPWDRAFWMILSRIWSGWEKVLHIVQPATVVRWHREGFRWFWTWKSRKGQGGHRRHEAPAGPGQRQERPDAIRVDRLNGQAAFVGSQRDDRLRAQRRPRDRVGRRCLRRVAAP